MLALLSLASLLLLLRLRTSSDARLAPAAAQRPPGTSMGAHLDFAALPTFLINGPEDYAARKWAEQQLSSVGLSSYERINGVILDTDDCLRLSGEGCQQGLALAHLSAWRRIAQRRLPAALVVEDDVTWHRDFSALLPRYLRQVPADWACMWLGQLPREVVPGERPPPPEHLTLARGVAPWTLHAYLLTWEAAELLATHYDFLLARAGSAHAQAPYPAWAATQADIARLPWSLSFRELKSDYFTALAVHYFVPARERHRWVAFASTRAVPAQLGPRTWLAGEDNELGRAVKTRCTCELYGDARACTAEDLAQRLPVMGTGLAYQNLCRYRRWALHNWLGAPGQAKAPSCAWLRARIQALPASDPSPHDCVDDVYPQLPKSTTPKEAVGGGNADIAAAALRQADADNGNLLQ